MFGASMRFVSRRAAFNIESFNFARRPLCCNSGATLPDSDCDQIVKEPLKKHELASDVPQYDIAIVGGGMVGMALACSLATTPLTSKLSVAIIDSNPALLNTDCLSEEGPPDPRVSTVTPATISFYKDMGAWQYVQKHRHAFFDKMQVWDYTGLGYTRYNARDVGKDILGCVVENKVLHRSLVSCIQNTDFKKRIYTAKLNSMASNSTGSLKRLDLSNGDSLQAKLVVGADGSKSQVRKCAGIETIGWKYPQNAIICTVEHAEKNQTAFQRFLPNGPIALLPIGDNFSNIVWTMGPAESSDRQSASEAEFVKAVNHALNRFTAPFEPPPEITNLASPRPVFPLALTHAKRYVSNRVVLIGDAAHTVHPLAGQGVNMGFADAGSLSRAVAEGVAVGSDIGEGLVLQRYEWERKPANMAMMGVLDGFQKAYSVDFVPVNLLRAAAFWAANYISPLKRNIVSFASGEGMPVLPMFT